MGEPATSIWQGHRVRLRPVEPEDWPLFHEWDQDDQTSRAAFSIPFPRSSAATRRWAERIAHDEPSGDEVRWVIVGGGDQPVGTINSHDCDRRFGSFSYGVAVAPRWRRRGFATEAIRLVLRYFFAELGYQKANAQVHEFNAGSRALHERLGFVPEGRVRRMLYTDGRHWDVLLFGLTREEFAAEQLARLPLFASPAVARPEA